MTELTVTANGHVTLPADILKHLGVQLGDKILIEKLANGRIEISRQPCTGKISDLFGVLWRPEQPTLTIDEMNEVISDAWAGKR